MPEIENNQAAGAGEGQGAGENSQAGADNNQANNAAGNEDAGDGDQGGEGKNKNGQEGQDDKNAKAPEGTQKKDDIEDDDGAEPATRSNLTRQDFIIGRQKAKLAKKAKANEAGEGGDNNDEGDEDDDEIAPEDEKLINKVFQKNIAPIVEKTQQIEDDKEINAFLTANPDFKPFEAKARRYIQHPSRRHLPVKTIFYEVAGDKLLKIGADRKTKADEEAKGTQTGGGSNRAGSGGEKPIWEMSKDEFEAEKERVRRGGN
jgi:hypothetical protein